MVGGGTSYNVTGVTSGTHNLGNVSLNITQPFANPCDIYCYQLQNPWRLYSPPPTPHYLPCVWQFDLYGSPGLFSVNLQFSTYPYTWFNPFDIQLQLFCSQPQYNQWNSLGSLGAVTPTSVWFNNITHFSLFTIGSDGDSSLPVTLSSFTATANDGQVTLRWVTQSEVNNVGFSIYRSEQEDGKYTKIAFVDGAGNSAMPRDYQFVDKKAEAGKTYFYYLEDIDIAGEKSKSDIIKVVVPPAKLIPKEFRLFQNYPNPFNPETWIPFDLAADANVTIRIYDVKGQLVRQLDLSNQKAGSYLDKEKAAYWNGKDQLGQSVSSGIYFYMLKAGDFVATRRMVILK